MTRTIRVSLGVSPLSGKQAVDSTQRFKEQLCVLHPKPRGVTLLTVEDRERQSRGVEVLYDADDQGAVEWVREAERVAGELWVKLAERRKGVVR
ncbi:MAG: hypothetical protein K8U57_35955 [Planctomycetes bacterium]|nr:hypothetical protein [Planctomycetota bacterium]